MRKRTGALLAVALISLVISGCSDRSARSLHGQVADAPTAFAGADGDLWPNCWADDGHVYAGHGDGKGFGSTFSDIGVERITGTPPDLGGETLALGDDVGSVWSGSEFTRKPTGMVCRDGVMYLAVQDLAKDFNQAPAASISRSDDHGKTWTWDDSAPMFDDGVFTTIMFIDYGKDGEHAPDEFVYAYGLDGNWRDSFSNVVADPVDLFLGRVPANQVQDRSAWQFFTGDLSGEPQWSPDISKKKSVLHEERTRYPDAPADQAHDLTMISQAGVLYNAPLDRYIYTSWTELTFEFYEARHPWGPYRHFMTRDWGAYPWLEEEQGGYGLSLPSKFVSEDGKSLWLQSNICPCAPAGTTTYDFSLRQFTISEEEER